MDSFIWRCFHVQLSQRYEDDEHFSISKSSEFCNAKFEWKWDHLAVVFYDLFSENLEIFALQQK